MVPTRVLNTYKNPILPKTKLYCNNHSTTSAVGCACIQYILYWFNS